MSGSEAVWLALDVSVFRCPSTLMTVGTIQTHGIELSCLDERPLSRENLFPVRFDDLLAQLAAHPRVDAEPDGFFVRAGEESGRRWKLNGHLFELDDRLWRVDLHGECPEGVLDEVLMPLGWPMTRVVFQLIRLGATVAEGDFRRWAAAAHAGGSK